MKLNTYLSQSLLLIFVAISMTSCSNNSDASKPNTLQPEIIQPDQAANDETEGGISAGGGGTLPANPIGIHKVFDIMDTAKSMLRMYLNYERQFPELSTITVKDKYFFGTENLATQLEKTDIEILADKPCKNKFGKDVDASIHASRPNTICLSAFRVAPKLIKETAQKEILALLVHELSHFLGSTEQEAIDIQRRAALGLQESISAHSGVNFEMLIRYASDPLGRLTSIKDQIKKHIQIGDVIAIRKEIDSIFLGFDQFDKYLGDKTRLNFTDYTINHYDQLMYAKIRLAAWYAGSIDPTNVFFDDSKERYENCFSGKSIITARELKQSCSFLYIDKNNLYLDYEIKKINSLTELNDYLADVFVYIHDLIAHTRSIAFDFSPTYFHLPNQTNSIAAWENFIGKYTVTEKNCTSQDSSNFYSDLQTIEIAPGISNSPIENEKIIMLTENSTGSMRSDGLSNGAGQYNSMRITGDSDSAQMTEEIGNKWYSQQLQGWNKTTKGIKKVNGQLIMTFKSEHFRYDYRGVEQSSSECQFKLK